MPNRLAGQTSPYLLQHAGNPVDWNPWGPEALEAAVREDKPIFLSIGYSACHWCHVMEHESFEDPALARRLNECFINIKVDREERPDLDQIYMQAVQTLTGRGGWPMSVFLTPQQQPFYGGTYWPPKRRGGLPGFDEVIEAVHGAWAGRRDSVRQQAEQLTQHLRQAASLADAPGTLSNTLISSAVARLERSFDHTNGGFGGAPKFPHPMDLRLLLRHWRRTERSEALSLVTLTLDRMAAGGIYDQLGGGFHRYSVDQRWLVPHFEKMLYDNAQLVVCYLEAFQATKNTDYARVATETLGYVLREMTDPLGGFYSTQDADSEGEEGKFYVWTPAEVERHLGQERARTFGYVYDVSDEGNFEGHNILNLPKTLAQCGRILNRDAAALASELADARRTLLAARGLRVPPGLDDKVVVSTCSLMIDALAQASGVLGEPRYLAAAERAAEFLVSGLARGEGRLWHSWRQGRAGFDAYLDDYACLINALVSLYEAGFRERWIDEATRLARVLVDDFHDAAGGGFFYTAHGHEPLITRHKDAQDGSVPSGNSMAATALLRLGKICGSTELVTAAHDTLATFATLMQRFPSATGQFLLALDFHLGPTPELVLAGGEGASDLDGLLSDLRLRYWPNKTVAWRASGGGDESAMSSIFADKRAQSAATTLYVCERSACQAPVTGSAAIRAMFDRCDTAKVSAIAGDGGPD